MRISQKLKFIYYSIPKTGSEAIRAFLDPYSDTPIVKHPQLTSENPFYSHMLPLEVTPVFARRGWEYEEFFRFATVRNPWARCASLYMMTQRSGAFPKTDFATFIQGFDPANVDPSQYKTKWFPNGAMPMTTFLSDESGALMVSKAYRLEDQLDELCEDLSAHSGLSLQSSQINTVNAAPVRYDWKALYGPRERDRVGQLYARDIEAFGYTFPG